MVMKTQPHPHRTATDRSGIEATVELAIKRNMEAGRTYQAALELICDKLSYCIASLTTAGFGDTSKLRAQLMSATSKLDECRQEDEYRVSDSDGI